MGFAMGTQIELCDGTTRSIEHIYMGELIMIDGERPLAVDNIYSGMESELLRIEFENENPGFIRLMPTSIVVTSTGEKQAIQLVCGDKIKCQNGGFAAVQDLVIMPNENIVYHLCFDKRVIHFAGGIAVGSWEAEEKYITPMSDAELEQIKKELRDKRYGSDGRVLARYYE